MNGRARSDIAAMLWGAQVEFFGGKPEVVCEWCGDADSTAAWGTALGPHFCASRDHAVAAESRLRAWLSTESGGGDGADALPVRLCFFFFFFFISQLAGRLGWVPPVRRLCAPRD
jgi:hypothetical protein